MRYKHFFSIILEWGFVTGIPNEHARFLDIYELSSLWELHDKSHETNPFPVAKANQHTVRYQAKKMIDIYVISS